MIKEVINAVPTAIWAFLVIAIILIVVIGYVANRSPSQRFEGAKIKFVWNQDTYTLETDDPNLSIKALSTRKEGPSEFILHWNQKKIGFSARSSRTESDGQKTWTLKRICYDIKRWFIEENAERVLTNTYSFDSRAEQDETLSYIRAGLGAFSSIAAPSPKTPYSVEISSDLQKKLDDGEFLKK